MIVKVGKISNKQTNKKKQTEKGCCVMSVQGILGTRKSNTEPNWWTQRMGGGREVGDSIFLNKK